MPRSLRHDCLGMIEFQENPGFYVNSYDDEEHWSFEKSKCLPRYREWSNNSTATEGNW